MPQASAVSLPMTSEPPRTICAGWNSSFPKSPCFEQRPRKLRYRKSTNGTSTMTAGRIFLLESPNALDLLEGTGETTSLSQVCRLFGHDIVSFLVRDKREFRQTLMYVSSVGWRKGRGSLPMFIHLSAHGNDDGLAIGPDNVTWVKLAALVVKTFRKIYRQRKPYAGPIVLVVSACGTDGHALSKHLRSAYRRNKLKWPPEYVFVFEDSKIDWRDAVVTWTIFYREAPRINFLAPDEKDAVKRLLDRVNRSCYGNLRYFRWDRQDHRYRTYAAQPPST